MGIFSGHKSSGAYKPVILAMILLHSYINCNYIVSCIRMHTGAMHLTVNQIIFFLCSFSLYYMQCSQIPNVGSEFLLAADPAGVSN